MQIMRDIKRYRIDEIFIQHTHELINHLPSNEGRKHLNAQHQQLIANIAVIKNDLSELQTLHLPKLTEDMMRLFASIHLLKEALHQQASSQNSKYNQWNYFQTQHRITPTSEQYTLIQPI